MCPLVTTSCIVSTIGFRFRHHPVENTIWNRIHLGLSMSWFDMVRVFLNKLYYFLIISLSLYLKHLNVIKMWQFYFDVIVIDLCVTKGNIEPYATIAANNFIQPFYFQNIFVRIFFYTIRELLECGDSANNNIFQLIWSATGKRTLVDTVFVKLHLFSHKIR